ncbi:CPBP family intramembrane glutamic endopeptidase [Eudoraea chungangensis]|uniref:CPBP family intramembrane glutamic endopeptidase n=1 Tax=Eudoraea chungangensis TaxID=1481905 RepID=UPI0023EAAF49|nr:CPBP family intramembrane glutamic endopeptidase [Eudoraea chungangensis]
MNSQHKITRQKQTSLSKLTYNKLLRLFNKENAVYNHYEKAGKVKSTFKKSCYLVSYLLPGIAAYILINLEFVYNGLTAFFGLNGYDFQYYTFVIFTLGWHIAFPVLMLRKNDGLEWKEIPKFLSLDRFSLKEILVAAPVAFALSVLLSLPYMVMVYIPFQSWLNSITIFQIPTYSIFASYEAFYGAPVFILIMMMVGNFIGEEIYFRGYLMKKTSFLGKYNWLVGSVLFCIYHLWQIPQTWPLIVPFLFFGLTMQLRKNLYTMIAFHIFFNLAGVQIYHLILGLGPVQ